MIVMAKIVTRFKNQLVLFWTPEDESPSRAICKGIVTEAGQPAYLMVHEDSGLEEPVFIDSVIRIICAEKAVKAAEVININEEKKSVNLRLIN